MPTRISGLAVTVFNKDATTMVGDLDEATLTVENDTEDGAEINAGWNYEIPLAYGWRIEADFFISAFPQWASEVAAADPTFALTFTTGVGSYTGTAIAQVSTINTGYGLQKERVTLLGQGDLTLA